MGQSLYCVQNSHGDCELSVQKFYFYFASPQTIVYFSKPLSRLYFRRYTPEMPYRKGFRDTALIYSPGNWFPVSPKILVPRGFGLIREINKQEEFFLSESKSLYICAGPKTYKKHSYEQS